MDTDIIMDTDTHVDAYYNLHLHLCLCFYINIQYLRMILAERERETERQRERERERERETERERERAHKPLKMARAAQDLANHAVAERYGNFSSGARHGGGRSASSEDQSPNLRHHRKGPNNPHVEYLWFLH